MSTSSKRPLSKELFCFSVKYVFQKLSRQWPLLQFLTQPQPLFRPKIWHFLLFSVSCMIKRKSQLKCHRVQFLWCWQIRTAYFNPADTSIDTVICCKLFVLIFNSAVLWDSPSTIRCEKSQCFPSRYESTLKTNRDSPVQVLYMSPTGSKERLCQRPSCKIPSNKLFKQNIWRKHYHI